MTLTVEPRGPISEGQIAAVEADLGVRLPEPYRSWLRETNGGELAEELEVPCTNGNGLLSDLDGVERLPIIRDLARNKVVPDDYVVVTLGHGGSLAIKVTGDDAGSVWWVDFDLADYLGVEGPSQEVMRRVADDWDGFLASAP